MTTKNKIETVEIVDNNAKPYKMYVALFSYGAKTEKGDYILTAKVSERYEAGKNEDGSVKWAYDTTLKASMILPESLAKGLTWTPFQTEKGSAGISTRVSIYGVVNGDRSEKGAGSRFWINPAFRKPVIQPDGSRKWEDCTRDAEGAQLMVFPVQKKNEAPAPKAKFSREDPRNAKATTAKLRRETTKKDTVAASDSSAPF